MELYGSGRTPRRLDREQAKLLKANVATVYRETATDVEYEGRVGASPRVGRTLLLDAAQSSSRACLSPFAVLEALDEVCDGFRAPVGSGRVALGTHEEHVDVVAGRLRSGLDRSATADALAERIARAILRRHQRETLPEETASPTETK